MTRAGEYVGEVSAEYRAFLEAVDREVNKIAGVSAFDLADYDYGSAYESELEPIDVAYDVLENDGFPMEVLDQ